MTPGSTSSPAHSLRRAPHTANKFANSENSPNFHFQWHQLNQIWKLNKIEHMDKSQIQNHEIPARQPATWCLWNGPKAHHQKELAPGQMTNKVVQLLKNHLFDLICTCSYISWRHVHSFHDSWAFVFFFNSCPNISPFISFHFPCHVLFFRFKFKNCEKSENRLVWSGISTATFTTKIHHSCG